MAHQESSHFLCTFLKNKSCHWFPEAGSIATPPLHGLVLEKNQSVRTRSSLGMTYIIKQSGYMLHIYRLCVIIQ